MEVVMVIGIICLLCAIAFPVFSSTKAKAQEVSCISNLKQLGAALELYHGDYGEYPWNENEAFSKYLSGAKLKCPAKSGETAYNLGTYRNLSFFRHDFPSPTLNSYGDALLACRNQRGPDYPLLADLNHLPQLLRDDEELKGEVYVYRASGGIATLSKRKFIAISSQFLGSKPVTDLPCSKEAQLGNL